MSTPRDRSLSIPYTSHTRTPSNSSPSTNPIIPPSSSHCRQPSSSGLSTLPPSLQQQLDPQPNRHHHPFRSHARSISGQFRGDFDGWANLDCLVPSKEDQLQPRGFGTVGDESSDEDDDEFLSLTTTRRRKSKDKDKGSEGRERSRSRLRGATFVIRSGRSGSVSGGGGGGMGHSRSASQPFLGSATMAAIQGMVGSSSVEGLDGRRGGNRFLGLGPNQGQQRGRSKSPAGLGAGIGHVRKGSSSGAGGSVPGVMGNHHNERHVAGEEFVTGRCMTCASLMRWPREHTVFRCTICMTVNDLVPVERGPSGDGQQHRDRDRPISLTHARALIEQCLREFLRERLGEMTAGKAPGDQPKDGNGKQKEREEDRGRRQEPAGVPRPPKGDKEVLPKLVLPPLPQRVPPPVPGQSLLRPPEMRGPRHCRGPSWSGTARSSRAEPSPGPVPFPRRQPSRDLLVQKPPPPPPPMPSRPPPSPPTQDVKVKRIFKPLEDYIVSCITNFHSLNTSFLTIPLPQHQPQPESSQHHKHHPDPLVTRKSPHLDWSRLEQFYLTILEPARPWFDVYRALVQEDPSLAVPAAALKDIEGQLLASQEHVQRAVLKACEAVLKRPGRRIRGPGEVRWLLILAVCPLFVAGWRSWRGRFVTADGNLGPASSLGTGTGAGTGTGVGAGPAAGANSGIIKRIVGLLCNAPVECHQHLVAWWARCPEQVLVLTKELMSGFLAYRLNRQNEKTAAAAEEEEAMRRDEDTLGGLVPSVDIGVSSRAMLHAALLSQARPGTANGNTGGGGSGKKKKDEKPKRVIREDWQIKAAATVLGLVFAANKACHSRESLTAKDGRAGYLTGYLQQHHHAQPQQHGISKPRAQVLPTSDFYITLLDETDVIADFETWSQRRGNTSHNISLNHGSATNNTNVRFTFCQHPYLLSIGAKMRILEHDTRRQMETRARDAFFNSLLSDYHHHPHPREMFDRFLTLRVRRECLVEDSLSAVGEAIGASAAAGGGVGILDVKKELRIEFMGEEGVDAGGLRKEWFLLLCRELFDPGNGMFLYDPDSHYCYFNPFSLEPSQQYFLVGVVLGLAIYNSTILDISLPPFAFRKLLASPSSNPHSSTLDDLAEYRPTLARGLRQLLDYPNPDEVEDVFALSFAITVDRYGVADTVELCPGGSRRPVTGANRREFVDLYVRYLLDTSVAKQFEPFKRGFWSIVGHEGGTHGLFGGGEAGVNVLSLFQPDEVELLIRGSNGSSGNSLNGDSLPPLDVAALKTAATYDGWERYRPKSPSGRPPFNPAEDEPTIRWFWETFESASPVAQRKLLAFVTGSDRVPAAGAGSLRIALHCLGDDCGRFPTARTCFNVLGLWRCGTKERLEEVLWRAVWESEGFGLK